MFNLIVWDIIHIDFMM